MDYDKQQNKVTQGQEGTTGNNRGMNESGRGMDRDLGDMDNGVLGGAYNDKKEEGDSNEPSAKEKPVSVGGNASDAENKAN